MGTPAGTQKVTFINESGLVVESTAPIQCTASNYKTNWALQDGVEIC